MSLFNSQWDCLTWPALDFPYNTIQRELDETPRLAFGSVNTCVTLGGKLAKRYGTTGLTGTGAGLPAGARIDRLWGYETLDTPPRVYIVASVAVTEGPLLPTLFGNSKTTWRLYYCNISQGVYWVEAPSYRGSNSSLRPHEASVSRGLLFVKSFPAQQVDTLGTSIFDGTGGTVAMKPWGGLGPTTPAAIVGNLVSLTNTGGIGSALSSFNVSALPFTPTPYNISIDFEIITVTAQSGTTLTAVLRGAQGTIPAAHQQGANIFYTPWATSAHPVTVNIGWTYSYAYESITGNVTNRVDIQTNPDNLPSATGPFLNMIPQITLTGLADTVNFPFIRVFRTTDGGGTFFQLDRIVNPGAGTFTYRDNSLTSAAGNSDPVPDAKLDSAIIAPTLTSNSPPPSALAPLVTGVAAVAPSTPIAYFQGRFWYAIGNVVFYSGEEEITLGVPEECWPSGTLGNFFRFQHQVVNLQATSNALYIYTTSDTHTVTGSNLATFDSQPVFQSIGAPYGHPRAVTRYGDSVAWLANDFRIVYAQGSTLFPLSDELGTDLSTAIAAGAEVDMTYWANLDKEYIVVAAVFKSTPANSRQWIFDIKKSSGSSSRRNFWYAPWNIPTTCLLSSRLNDTSTQRSLVFANNGGGLPFLAAYDTTGVAAADTDPSGTIINQYNHIIRTGLFMTPSGDHINSLRRPGVTPEVLRIQIDRTKYPSDKDPQVIWFRDDLWTTPRPLPSPTIPDYLPQSLGYTTLLYPVNEACQHIAVQIQKLASPDRFELQELTIVFDPTPNGR